MKKLVILGIILCISLLGCESETDTSDIKKVDELIGPSDVKEYGSGTDEGNKAEPAKKEAEELDPEIQSLIDKADGISSLEYNFKKYIDGGVSRFYTAAVKGDKMRQEYQIRSGRYDDPEKMYSAVYLDIADRKAVAYCEDTDHCNDPNKPKDMVYEGFIVESPFDVLESISSAEKVNTEMHDGKETVVIEDKKDGKYRKIWLWEYKGLPLKYEIRDEPDEKAKIKVEFANIQMNSVKDSDLEHQEIEVKD